MNNIWKKGLGLIMLLVLSCPVWAQTEDVIAPLSKSDDETYKVDTAVVVYKDTIVDVAVNTNSWKHNWFLAANVGYHKLWADYSSYGKLMDTFAPAGNVSVGRWITPTFGAGIEAGIGQSRGFTVPGHTTPYTIKDELLTTDDGRQYYKQKINWTDVGTNVYLNLSRLALGYEGAKSKSLMGQFVIGLGIGWVHHFNYENGNPHLNEISGKVDLQYSQFLSAAKRVSIDLKLRYMAYQTNFDGNYDYAGCQKWDRSLGIVIGLTFHSKRNTWTKPLPIAYQTVYKTRELYNTIEEAPVEGVAKLNTITFYVLYPDGQNTDIATLARTSMVNDHLSLNEIVNAGYKAEEMDKLYSLADVYAAVLNAKGEATSVPGSDNTSVQELTHILQTAALTKITVLSVTSDMDYYANTTAQQRQNVLNMELANKRAQEMIGVLKQAPRMDTAMPQVMLINDMDINKEQCMKVTVQYLSK